MLSKKNSRKFTDLSYYGRVKIILEVHCTLMKLARKLIFLIELLRPIKKKIDLFSNRNTKRGRRCKKRHKLDVSISHPSIVTSSYKLNM